VNRMLATRRRFVSLIRGPKNDDHKYCL